MGGARVVARPYQTGQGMKPDAWRPTGVKPIGGNSLPRVLGRCGQCSKAESPEGFGLPGKLPTVQALDIYYPFSPDCPRLSIKGLEKVNKTA
jgi:hypothetical protein